MSIKLTDAQLVMLSAAAQRDDRCLTPSQALKGGAAQKVAAKLVAVGLVKEIKAKPGTHVWRRDEEAGQSYTLKLTTAGARAIAIDESPDTDSPTGDAAVASREPVAAAAPPTSPQTNPDESAAGAASNAAPSSSAPRDGTKLAQVIALLRRDIGATLDDLIAATGWLPHTTRAALTGLRKRGYPVTRERSNPERQSIYFLRPDRTVVGESDAAHGETIPVCEPAAVPAAKPKTERPAASRPRKAA
jgi:Protein of unknown function (DUF3489)